MAVTKVSMSLDADVLAQTRDRVGGRGVSAYVNEAVRRQLQRDALADLLVEMQAANGPIDDHLLEEVRNLWPGRDDADAPPPE